MPDPGTATITLPLDTTYSFDGFGTHDGLFDKSPVFPTHTSMPSAVNLTDSEWTRFATNVLSKFTWLRIGTGGYEQPAEGVLGGRNYPAHRMAARRRDLNANYGPFTYILTPYAPPSACMVENSQTTWRISNAGLTLTSADDVTAKQTFVESTANWQAWLDQIAAGILAHQAQGCAIRYFTWPNEHETTGVTTLYNVYMPQATVINYGLKIWLGQGLTGGGIKARFPGLSLVYTDPVNNEKTLSDALNADATLGPEISYWDGHWYGSDWTLQRAMYGLDPVSGTNMAYRLNKAMVTEVGAVVDKANASLLNSDFVGYGTTVHRSVSYGRARAVVEWAAMRDHDYLSTTFPGGYRYTAKCLCNFDHATGTFSYTPMWWQTLPFLLAAGRGPCLAVCSNTLSNRQSANAAGFDPATDVTATAFVRRDGSKGIVIRNGTASTRNDVLSLTLGGSGIVGDATVRTILMDGTSDTTATAVALFSGKVGLTLPAYSSAVVTVV